MYQYQQYLLFVLQCLALVGAGFLQVGVGTELICSTVIIGALLENSNENEWLTMTIEQQSWFGEHEYFYKYIFSILVYYLIYHT